MLIFLTLEEAVDRNKKIEQLLSKISASDKEAFGELYSLIKADIYAYALSKTASVPDAEDILEETFVNIYRYSSKYKPRGKPMAWVITIASNLILRQRQIKGRHISYDDAISEEASDMSIEANAVRSEFVRALLSALNEREREIVVLHAVSGFKHKEIAKHLSLPLSTVLSKYNRAIAKMKLQIKEGERV